MKRTVLALIYLIAASSFVMAEAPQFSGILQGAGQIGVNYVDPGNDTGVCSHLDGVHEGRWHYTTHQDSSLCIVLYECSWTTAAGSFVTAFIKATRKLSLIGAGVSLACTGVEKLACPPPARLGRRRTNDLIEGYLDGRGVCQARVYRQVPECEPIEDPHFCD